MTVKSDDMFKEFNSQYVNLWDDFKSRVLGSNGSDSKHVKQKFQNADVDLDDILDIRLNLPRELSLKDKIIIIRRALKQLKYALADLESVYRRRGLDEDVSEVIRDKL